MSTKCKVPLMPFLLVCGVLAMCTIATFLESKTNAKEDKKSLGEKIGEARQKAGEVGDQIIAGAKQLQHASTLLQEGKKQLKEDLIDNLESIVKKQVAHKITDIQQKRLQLAQFKKELENKKNIADQAGKGALMKNLLEGLSEADAALAMLYNDSPQPSGILVEFMEASDSAVKKSNKLVAQLDKYLIELDQKIGHKKFCLGPKLKCTLPVRLGRIGFLVKRLAPKDKKEDK